MIERKNERLKKKRINKSYAGFRDRSEKPRGLFNTAPSEKQRDYNDETITLQHHT